MRKWNDIIRVSLLIGVMVVVLTGCGSIENETPGGADVEGASSSSNPGSMGEHTMEEEEEIPFVEHTAPPVKQVDGNDNEWISMTIKEGTVTPSGLTLLMNAPNYEGTFGTYYVVERKTKQEWKPVEYIIENAAFNEIAYLLPKGQTQEIVVDWEWLYGKLEPGTYRISKSLYLGEESETMQEYVVKTEFEVK